MATTNNHTGAVAVAFWEDCIECFGDGGDDVSTRGGRQHP